jgi:N-acetylglutamate synthase/N-acetylornithine aminotransferase
MKAERVVIELDLAQGRGTGFLQASDLTYEYVRINADYTT